MQKRFCIVIFRKYAESAIRKYFFNCCKYKFIFFWSIYMPTYSTSFRYFPESAAFPPVGVARVSLHTLQIICIAGVLKIFCSFPHLHFTIMNFAILSCLYLNFFLCTITRYALLLFFAFLALQNQFLSFSLFFHSFFACALSAMTTKYTLVLSVP